MNDGSANDIDICEWRIIVRVPLVSMARRRAAGRCRRPISGDETKDLAHDVEHRLQLLFAEPPERVGSSASSPPVEGFDLVAKHVAMGSGAFWNQSQIHGQGGAVDSTWKRW